MSSLDKVTTFKLCKIGKIGLGGVFPPIKNIWKSKKILLPGEGKGGEGGELEGMRG